MALFCLMVVTACSSGDVPGEETSNQKPAEAAISFNSGLTDGEDISRGDGLEEQTTSFKVWAYKNLSYTSGSYGGLQTVIDGYAVNYVANSANTTTTNTNNWEYVGQGTDQTIKYWDWSAKAYRFFGVAGGATANYGAYGKTGENGPYNITLTVDASSDDGIAATPYYSHLWFSTGNTANYPDKQFGKPVQLEFLKPIARVRFMFTFVPELTDLGIDRTKLSGISFKPTLMPGEAQKNIADEGTITISYPLTGTATKESWTSEPSGYLPNFFEIDYYEPNPDHTPGNSNATTYPNTPHNWYNVLPRNSQGSYTLTTTVVGGDPKTCVVPAEYMSWEPGYQYTYIFKITEAGGITLDAIQVAINDWTIKEYVEHPVFNW